MKQILQRKIIKTGSMAQATLSCRYAAIHLVYHGFYTVSPFHVGLGALTPPQTQFVGETLVPRQTYIVSYRYRFPIPSAEHTNTQANFRDFYQFLSCARHGYMV